MSVLVVGKTCGPAGPPAMAAGPNWLANPSTTHLGGALCTNGTVLDLVQIKSRRSLHKVARSFSSGSGGGISDQSIVLLSIIPLLSFFDDICFTEETISQLQHDRKW